MDPIQILIRQLDEQKAEIARVLDRTADPKQQHQCKSAFSALRKCRRRLAEIAGVA